MLRFVARLPGCDQNSHNSAWLIPIIASLYQRFRLLLPRGEMAQCGAGSGLSLPQNVRTPFTTHSHAFNLTLGPLGHGSHIRALGDERRSDPLQVSRNLILSRNWERSHSKVAPGLRSGFSSALFWLRVVCLLIRKAAGILQIRVSRK